MAQGCFRSQCCTKGPSAAHHTAIPLPGAVQRPYATDGAGTCSMAGVSLSGRVATARHVHKDAVMHADTTVTGV